MGQSAKPHKHSRRRGGCRTSDWLADEGRLKGTFSDATLDLGSSACSTEKSNEQARGTQLAGLAVKITDGFFLVGLSWTPIVPVTSSS